MSTVYMHIPGVIEYMGPLDRHSLDVMAKSVERAQRELAKEGEPSFASDLHTLKLEDLTRSTVADGDGPGCVGEDVSPEDARNVWAAVNEYRLSGRRSDRAEPDDVLYASDDPKPKRRDLHLTGSYRNEPSDGDWIGKRVLPSTGTESIEGRVLGWVNKDFLLVRFGADCYESFRPAELYVIEEVDV